MPKRTFKKKRTFVRPRGSRFRNYASTRNAPLRARRGKYVRKTAYRRRRSYKRKSSKFSSYIRDPRAGIYPTAKRATLVYVNEGIALQPPAAKGCAITRWSCNGLYDPEHALGGHQPLYFDDMMRIYQNYYVFASRIEVVFSFPDQSDARAYHAGIAVRRTADDTESQPHVYAENGGCKSFVHCQNGSSKTISLSYYPGKTYGLTQSVCRNMPELWGTSSSNPQYPASFHIFVGNATDAAIGANITVSLKIQYDTLFFNVLGQDPNMSKQDTFPTRSEDPEMVDKPEEMVSVPASMMARMGLA